MSVVIPELYLGNEIHNFDIKSSLSKCHLTQCQLKEYSPDCERIVRSVMLVELFFHTYTFFISVDGANKKLRSTIRRSTETGIAVEMRNRVTRQGSKESTDGSTNSNSSEGT